MAWGRLLRLIDKWTDIDKALGFHFSDPLLEHVVPPSRIHTPSTIQDGIAVRSRASLPQPPTLFTSLRAKFRQQWYKGVPKRMHNFNRFNLMVYPVVQLLLWRSKIHTGFLGWGPVSGVAAGLEGFGLHDLLTVVVSLALIVGPFYITSHKFFVSAVRMAHVFVLAIPPSVYTHISSSAVVIPARSIPISSNDR